MKMMLRLVLKVRYKVELTNVAQLFLMIYSDVLIEKKTVGSKHVETH